MNVRKVLYVSFLGILFISFSMNASEQRNNLEWLLFSADRSLNQGHLGIFYDPQYRMKQGNNLNLNDLFKFRNRNETESSNIVDYAVDEDNVFKITYPKQISELGEKKHLYSLLGSTDATKRGLILYYTQINQQKNSTEQQKNYVEEIKKIREAGWSVVAMCHELQIAQDIDKAFFGDDNKSKSIVLTPKDPFYRNALLLAVFIVTVSWLCHKYDLSSYFK